MKRAYVGLGSNIEPETNVRAAFRLLAARERVVAVSTFHRTESIPRGAPDFINGVVAIETDEGPLELKRDVLREIEARLGRMRMADKSAPRTIDCDLLVYDDEVASPDVETRAFAAIPLHELAPDLILPGSGRKLAEVAAHMSSRSMVPLVELTNALRRELEVKDGSNAHGNPRSRAPRRDGRRSGA